MHLSFRRLQPLVFTGTLAAALCLGSNAIAAERVVLKYKIFRESIPVTDLTTFAKTGEISSTLQFYLNASRQNPEDFRTVLTREADVKVTTLDRALNNPVGELLLDQIGLAVHPPANVANRQAIRAALVLSASQDNKISLIEVIQNYPTAEVEVEGERVVQAYRQISAIGGRVRNLADDLIRLF